MAAPATALADIPAEIVTCNTCCDQKMYYEVRSCERCKNVTCLPCLQYWVKDNVKRNANVLIAPCQCKTPLKTEEIMIALDFDQNLIEKFNEMSVKTAMLSFGSIVYCPNPKKCNEINMRNVKNEERKDKQIICSKCDYAFCSECLNPYHDGKSCEDVMNKDDIEFKKWNRDNKTKPCNACGYPVEKIEGCNRITCGGCSSKFCWSCGALDPDDNHYDYCTPSKPAAIVGKDGLTKQQPVAASAYPIYSDDSDSDSDDYTPEPHNSDTE